MDKYYVYRPLLDLIGYTEGTDAGRGYDETLAYGLLTGGPVSLTTMTLDEVDALQTKMLAHPKNKWNSSAAGRYQIVRTTRRDIQKKLLISGTAKYNAEMQDRMGCFLLGKRGIDKWLEGRMSENELLMQLAAEWASMPKPNGRSYYGDVEAAVDVDYVRDVLAEVKQRWIAKDHPYTEIPESPVVVKKPSAWPFIIAGGAIMLVGLAALLMQ